MIRKKTNAALIIFCAAVTLGVELSVNSAIGQTTSSSPWNAEMGWNGLVVGKNTLKDAETKLGKISSVENAYGSKCYNFKNSKVNVFLDADKKIEKIWVSGDLKDAKLMPRTAKEAKEIYGFTGRELHPGDSGDTYIRPGIKLLTDRTVFPEGITWIEFGKDAK